MLQLVNFTRLENRDERLAGEFTIATQDGDGAGFTLALCDLGKGKFAPEIRCFSDGLANLAAFMLVGGAKVLDGEYESADGLANALVQAGIWET